MIVSIFLLIFYTLSTIKIEYKPAEEIKGEYIKTINTPGKASDIFVEKIMAILLMGKKAFR